MTVSTLADRTGSESATITASDPFIRVTDLPDCQRFVIRGVSWESYRELSEALSDRHVRLTYDRGTLELMTISHLHGYLVNLLSQIVIVLARASGLRRKSCSDMTCDREDLHRAMEPDASFYLQNEQAVRGKETLDFQIDPPPDLGIEVDLTTDSRSRLPIYAALRIPEVWRFKNESVTFLHLNQSGGYAVSETSRAFPFLASTVIDAVLARRTETDEQTLIDEFSEWVLQNLPAA